MKKILLALMTIVLLNTTAHAEPKGFVNRVNAGGVENHINYTQGEYKKYIIENIEELQEVYRDILKNYISYAEIEISDGYSPTFEEVAEITNSPQAYVSGVDATDRKIIRDGNKIKFRIAYSTTEEERQEVQQFIDKWVAENISGAMSDMEKTVAIYDMVTQFEYYKTDETDLSEAYPKRLDPYSLIKHGKGVCHASAGLFRMTAEKAGVETMDIAGWVNDTTFHIWNLVHIDGKWYHIDASWDAGRTTKKYFLQSDNEAGVYKKWNYDKYPECRKDK